MTTSFDEQGIREAIRFYAEGMRTGDVETLKRAFHEQAILCGYLGDDLIAGPIPSSMTGWRRIPPRQLPATRSRARLSASK